MHFPHNHRGSYFTTYREDDWKLIYYYNPEHSERPDCILYNLAKDPEERQDISDLYPQQTLKMLHGMIDRLELENALYPVNFEGKEIKPDLEYFQAKFAGK